MKQENLFYFYVKGREASLAYGVKADMIATGKCNVDLGKERFMNLKVAWTMKKNSPYTDIVNRGYCQFAGNSV